MKRVLQSVVAGLFFAGCLALGSASAFAADGHGAEEHGKGAEGAGEAHGGHHGPGAINWIDFGNKKQPPYAALVINFAILVGLYYYLGKKPVAEALKKRRDDVAHEIEEAQRIRREAEERASQYQAKLAKLEDELAQARQALVEAGKGERDAIVKEAEDKAARMNRDAEFLLEQELKQMKADLVRETVEVAVRAAEELLTKRVTQSDQQRIAEEFLGQLGAHRAAQGGAS